MSVADKIYAAVKAYCEGGQFTGGEDCFAIIAKNAGVPVGSLEYFLNDLQKLGLVSYSLRDKCISLTKMGKRQDVLPEIK